MVFIEVVMIPVMERIIRGEVVIKPTDSGWKITSIGNNFLDWMRLNYKNAEDSTWQVWYYSGSMNIIEVIDEKMMTIINLRWS